MEGLSCLQCGQPLDQDFGIVACTNCGAVLMIDMDGQVQLATDNDKPTEPASSFEAFSDPATEGPFSENEPAVFGETPNEPRAEIHEDLLIERAEDNLELNANGNSGDALGAASDEASVESSAAESSPADDNANWFDQGLDQPTPEPDQAMVPVSSGDFSDVSDFGNQDVDAGALQFDLTLSGIDHKEMRAEVMNVLADPRLYLNLRDLPVKNGTIVLPGLNAARTSLIVTRLQHLDLKINWKQRLYEA